MGLIFLMLNIYFKLSAPILYWAAPSVKYKVEKTVTNEVILSSQGLKTVYKSSLGIHRGLVLGPL